MSPRHRLGVFVSYRNAGQSVPGTMRIQESNRRLSLHCCDVARLEVPMTQSMKTQTKARASRPIAIRPHLSTVIEHRLT